MMPFVRKHLPRLAVAAFVILLWSAPHMASRFQESVRRYVMWERQDAWWLLAPILAYAVLCALLAALVDWSGKHWARRAFHGLFLLALGGGILTEAVHHLAKLRPYPIPLLGVATHFGWLASAAIAGYVCTRERSRIVDVAKGLCLIGSPSVLLVAWQLAGGPVYPVRMDPLPTAAAQMTAATVESDPTVRLASAQGSPSVFWFIFDEWSYERTYADGRLRPAFKHVEQFSRQATVFHDARSPASCTEFSFPAMLYSTKLPSESKDGRLSFRNGDELVPSERMESVMAKAGRCGYYRVLIGFGLPHSQWFGRDADLCRAYSFYPADPRGLSESFSAHMLHTGQFSPDPLMKYLYERWTRSKPWYDYYRQLHTRMHDDVEWALTQSPRHTFTVVHYCLPHHPYLFNEDGSPRSTDVEAPESSVESYERNLACLDHRIGEFMDMLRTSGRLDNSLVILTSDHSWRYDPNRKGDKHNARHVPLIVKFPGGQEGREVREPFETYRLGDLIAEALGAPTSPGYRPAVATQLPEPPPDYRACLSTNGLNNP